MAFFSRVATIAWLASPLVAGAATELKGPADPFDSMGGTEAEIRSQMGSSTDDDRLVIQNRYFQKQFRNQLRVGGGNQLAGDEFMNVQEVSAAYRFYFTEWLGAGFSFRQRFRQLTDDYQRLADQSAFAPEVVAPRFSYGLDLTFVPAYAKLSLFDRQITRLEMYVDAGAHRYHTEQQILWSSRSAIGARFLWTKWISTSLELSHDLFVEDRLGGRTLRSLVGGALHVSMWL